MWPKGPGTVCRAQNKPPILGEIRSPDADSITITSREVSVKAPGAVPPRKGEGASRQAPGCHRAPRGPA